MKLVLSPAKSLDFTTPLPEVPNSAFLFLKEAKTIHGVLKKKKPKQLAALMDISEKLADLNWQRNQEWGEPFTTDTARQAIYAFNGDVYLGLDIHTLPIEKIEVLQQKVRILSGLYGLLQPLDLIKAYRLEMGTSLPIGRAKNLYAFWKKSITTALNNELEDGELFLNLASQEYFSAIDVKSLKVPVITVEFKDYKDGKLKVISFFAKKARGLMVRYMLDFNVETIEGLKGFNYEGYGFDANLSSETTLVFTR